MNTGTIIWKQLFIHTLMFTLLTATNGQCEFPTTFQGEYILSKSNSLVTVHPNNITGIRLLEALNLESVVGRTYECIVNSGNKYVLRSTKWARDSGTDRYVYFCMDLTLVSKAKATYVQATKTGPGRLPYNCKYMSVTKVGADPMSAVCDLPESAYTTTKYSVLLKTSEQLSWPQTCPADILGIFTNQDPDCPVTADVCADNRYIQLDNTSSCSVAPFFSANGSVTCVHEVRNGAITYIHLYNNDNYVNNTDTFRYTCVALEKTAAGILMSQNPGDCVTNQQPDNATTDGKTTFNFSHPATSKLCPITTTSTISAIIITSTASTTIPSGGLSTAGSVGLVLGLLGLLALVVIFILCVCIKRKKKKRKMEEMARRREENRLERRRRRRERRLKRMQEGLPPHGEESDSSDSGYSGRSTSTLVRSEEEDEEQTEREEQEEMRSRMRRVYDVDGNLLYEEEIPDTNGNEEPGESDKDETRGGKRKKRVKKTRKYVREKTLPDGTVVHELVESDYWSTDSETSGQSWRQDPVRTEVQMAKLKRKRDRQSMMERSNGNNVSSFVTRPEAERKISPERNLVTLPKIFQKLARGKRKLPEDSDRVDEIPDSDRFLPQYHHKKQTEWRLEDEGFWDDPKTKKTALEIFDFDNLDAQLDESVKFVKSASRRGDITPSMQDVEMEDEGASNEKEGKSDTDRESRLSAGGAQHSQSREGRHSKLPTIEVPSRFVSGSHDDTCEELPSILIGSEDNARGNDRQRILASLSRLLTDRLFSEDDTRGDLKTQQSGRVIFVEECGGERPLSQQRPASQESRRTSSNSSHPQTGNDTSNTPDLPGDQPKFETSQSVELPPLTGQGRYRHRYTSHGTRGIGPERASLLRQGLLNNRKHYGRLTRTPRPLREAWTDPNSPTETNYPPWSIKNKDADWSQADDTKCMMRSHDASYLDLDDARLRRLLEELYKDKKYMDALLAAKESSSYEEVKCLAEHGRNYLLHMALYWEKKGPLPPRPSSTALGFKMERARTANARRAQTARAQTTRAQSLDRNKTVC